MRVNESEHRLEYLRLIRTIVTRAVVDDETRVVDALAALDKVRRHGPRRTLLQRRGPHLRVRRLRGRSPRWPRQCGSGAASGGKLRPPGGTPHGGEALRNARRRRERRRCWLRRVGGLGAVASLGDLLWRTRRWCHRATKRGRRRMGATSQPSRRSDAAAMRPRARQSCNGPVSRREVQHRRER